MPSSCQPPETNSHPHAPSEPGSLKSVADLLLRAESLLQSQIQLIRLADGGRMIPSSTLIGFRVVLEEANALIVRTLDIRSAMKCPSENDTDT